MSSFRPAGDIFRFAGTFGIDTLVPRRLTLENYEQIFSGPFPRSLFNSLFVAFATVALGVIVNSMAGFAFAVFDFPFKKPLFVAVLLSFMMPFESIVIPLYTLMRTLNWTDTYAALILPRSRAASSSSCSGSSSPASRARSTRPRASTAPPGGASTCR